MPDMTYLDIPHEEGYLPVKDYELYYRQFGTGDTLLLGLHGGPGMPHEYLLPLAQHSQEERRVVLYDQFGVGRSARPAPGDFDRYTLAHYLSEVESVRQVLDPSRFIVYGQSWGGMLAQEYALQYGERLDGLVLANTLSDSRQAYRSMRSHVEALPEDKLQTIREHEAKRDFDNPAYLEALEQVYANHVCRLETYPRPIQHTLEHINTDIYGLMWGPNEYVLLEYARLRDWRIKDELHQIQVPTLVITGAYDEIEPAIARDIADAIPGAAFEEFSESSHMPLWEQPEEHFTVVESFLEHV